MLMLRKQQIRENSQNQKFVKMSPRENYQIYNMQIGYMHIYQAKIQRTILEQQVKAKKRSTIVRM